MSGKERNKLRRYVGPFETRAERHWKAVTPFFYKKLEQRERLFHRLFSQGPKAQEVMDRCRRIKGLQYDDAEDIAITLWTPAIE
ncbi:MAG: hypothetical protein IH624_06080 [Phycisphaerae bacterium]|nr:hypothetical protein [Phycisphaerae bacterium]